MDRLIRRVEALERIAPPAERLVIWHVIVGPETIGAPMAHAEVAGRALIRHDGESEAQFLERAGAAALAAVPPPRTPSGIVWPVGR